MADNDNKEPKTPDEAIDAFQKFLESPEGLARAYAEIGEMMKKKLGVPVKEVWPTKGEKNA